MKANAAQIRAGLAAPSPKVRLYLLHGPDEAGAADLVTLLGRAMGAEAERVDLDGATLRSDPARLADEAVSLSLFGTRRYLRVTNAGEESVAALTALLAMTGETSPVVVLAPAVRTTAKIVKLAIDTPAALAFACYQPDAAGAERLVATMAGEHGLSLDPGVAVRLVEATGGDRALMAREVDKFSLYVDAAPSRPSRLDHAALDALGAALDDGETTPLVAALIDGDTAEVSRQLAVVEDRGGSPVTWLRQVQRRLLTMAEMRAAIDAGEAVGPVMKRHRIFFREEASTAAALRRWTSGSLAGALDRVRAAERAVMRSGNAGAVLANHTAAELARRGTARR